MSRARAGPRSMVRRCASKADCCTTWCDVYSMPPPEFVELRSCICDVRRRAGWDTWLPWNRGETMKLEETIARYAPYVLSILRIVAGLLFLEHGMSRLFGFPSPLPTSPVLSLYWFAGAIEFFGGLLVLLGLFTRPAAFIMSGEMA